MAKFGKLSHKDCYHCHLRRGRPTYVAVWRIVDKESRIIEGLMSEPTNEPITTDYVNVSFRIPVKNLQKAKKALAVLGAEENAGSVSWREIFPGFDGGLALKGARKRESLTQKQLAGLLGISQTHISEMEHGKRPIGKEMARRLAQVLKVEYRVFL